MESPHLPQLDYASPEQHPFPFRWTILLLTLWTVGIALLIAPMVFVVPMFAATFRDFATTLPRATLLLIICSRWCISYGLVPLLLTFVFAASLAVILALRPDGANVLRRTVTVSFAILLGMLVIEVLFLVIALFAPMLNLIQSVSKP